jgi:hypothetical protein
LISGCHFRDFRLASLPKFSKFSMRNIVQWIFKLKNNSDPLSSGNFMSFSAYSEILQISFYLLNKKILNLNFKFLKKYFKYDQYNQQIVINCELFFNYLIFIKSFEGKSFFLIEFYNFWSELKISRVSRKLDRGRDWRVSTLLPTTSSKSRIYF